MSTTPTTRKASEEERSEAQEEKQQAEPLYICLHCTEVDLPVEAMEPLQDGSPSNCCKPCWKDYKDKEASERPSRIARWRASVKKEEEEAHRREAEKLLSKKEKEKVASGRHSLRLVE